MNTLSSRSRAVLTSLVPAVCPPEARNLAADIVDHVALSVAAMPREIGLLLATGLVAYDRGAHLWLPGKGRAARKLAPDLAARYFESWWASPLLPCRELAKAAKGLLCLACYEMPAIKEALGYAPEAWIAEVKKRRLTVHKPAIARHAAALTARDPLPPISVEGVA